jgi:hypothetical protein
MAASPITGNASPRLRWWHWGLLLLLPVAGVAGTSWWLTEPLEDHGADTAPAPDLPRAPRPELAAKPHEPLAWPDERLEGMPAKQLLLDVLLDVDRRLDAIDFYTATFRKRERLRGVLGSEQTLAMKVRQHPFAIYLKFLDPTPGKEVVYAEGHHDNKVIAHATGVSRWLVPRLAVPPDHPLALAETRHAVTEAGLANLTEKLIGYRRIDINDPEAITILDRTTDDDGRAWLRSLHLHPANATSQRPFARVEVLYDPETRFPLRIKNYDWPKKGHKGELLLAESYRYDDLNLNAPLTALDFDPANPAYAFHR